MPFESGSIYSSLGSYGLAPPPSTRSEQSQALPDLSVTSTKARYTHIDSEGVISFNDVKFLPVLNSPYISDYKKLAEEILNGDRDEVSSIREMCKYDLWFLTFFILGNPIANDLRNHWVKMSRMVQFGPRHNVLDLWAREHGKTTLLTENQTIQDLLIDPNETVAIFSYTQTAARVFFRNIRHHVELNTTLKELFPDIFWETPPHKGVQWNDDGITLKRKFSQKECSIEPWGLLEGMPTGRHFSKRKYDDISTQDLADSPAQMERMKNMFDMSENVGKDGGTVSVTGTFYHHEDVLCYIRDKKTKERKPVFTVRKVCATDDNTFNGKSIYLSEERMETLKQNRRFFNSQQLLNPTPDDDVKLPYGMVTHIRADQVPKDILKIMVIDPAGAKRKDGRRNDAWAMWVLAMERKLRFSGVFNVYIIDGVIGRFRQEEAINEAAKIYMRNGYIRTCAVEKVGLATMEIHLSNALRAKGRIVTIENKMMRVVSPGNRPKHVRIEGNLATPLYNGALHLVDTISAETRSQLREEMERYGAYHDDGLDALAYGFDILSEFATSMERMEPEEKVKKPYQDPYESIEKKTTLSWMSR